MSNLIAQIRMGDHRFVLKTDVKSCYASISHGLAIESLAPYIHDPLIIKLIYHYLKRSGRAGRSLLRVLPWHFTRLPPEARAWNLLPLSLDVALERLGLFYIRFMDAIVALAPARRKLRQAVHVLNQTLGPLEPEKHPDKTCIGQGRKASTFSVTTSPRKDLN